MVRAEAIGGNNSEAVASSQTYRRSSKPTIKKAKTRGVAGHGGDKEAGCSDVTLCFSGWQFEPVAESIDGEQ